MNYWIPENSHIYLPGFVLPYFKKDLHFEVEFPTTTWYDENVQAGWNKLLMLGKLFHYADYCTIGWQWMNPNEWTPEDTIFKGRTLCLAAVWHNDWNYPKWEHLGYYKHSEPIICTIFRAVDGTVFSAYQDKDHKAVFNTEDQIRGRWIRSPYFGGRSKSQFQHILKIKML